MDLVLFCCIFVKLAGQEEQEERDEPQTRRLLKLDCGLIIIKKTEAEIIPAALVSQS